MRSDTPSAALRSTLAERQVIGTFVKLSDVDVLDMVAGSGADFAIVDLEHSSLSDGAALRLVRYGWAIGLPAVVRLPECDHGLVNRLLEAGAAGIQLSTVRSVSDVERLVASTRYAPGGTRSVSLSHVGAGYGRQALRDALAVPPPLLVAQIETVRIDDPIVEIARAGADVLFLGTTDLAVDAGFDEATRARVAADVEGAALAAGIAFGAFAADRSSISPSHSYVALSSDMSLLRHALDQAVSGAR